MLAAYAGRLGAVELNNTFYRRPSAPAIESWLAATPPGFRFCPKAQRGSPMRAFSAADPTEAIAWLATALSAFGERLGAVLMGVPRAVTRDDAALARLLSAWPRSLPLALELAHPSWTDDAVHEQLIEHAVTLVASDADVAPEPDLRRTGPSIYLRLRRATYSPADLERWARRLEPFLEAGIDAYVFLRHDADGTSALRAEALAAVVAERASSGL